MLDYQCIMQFYKLIKLNNTTMRKFLLGMLAIVAMVATSCQKDTDLGVGSVGETVSVSINVGTPTRSYSDGLTAKNLQYAVYDAAGGYLSDLTGATTLVNGAATVELKLVTGNEYDIICWAAAEGAPYTVNFAEKKMSVNYNGVECNNESLDAFYKKQHIVVRGAQSETIELKRPFAQLNIGTNDYAKATNAGYTPTHSAVKVTSIYNTLNLWDGSVSGETAVEFGSAEIEKGEEFPVDNTKYDYLAMNYLLVSAAQETIEVEFTYTDGVDAKTRTVGSVPVQRNYRTNIYGALLTSNVDINVVIKPEYEMPDYDHEVYSLKPVYYDEAKTQAVEGVGIISTVVNAEGETVPAVYGVTSANGLKWASAQISGATLTRSGSDDKKYEVNGTTIKLLADIDLTGVTTNGDSFSPIGLYCSGQGVNKPFTGHFDGNGHTIKGIYQSGWDFGYEWGTTGYLGLFGYVVDATIENLTIEGLVAEVEGGTLAAVAGRADGECTFKNITVKNCKLGTYNNRCGGIVGWTGGYYKDEAQTEVACHFVFENITICDDVVLGGLWGSFDSSIGGVMGQLNSGATNCLLKNVTVSCRIDAYNDCTASYDYYLYRMCGMLIGQMTKTTTIDGSTYPDVAAYGIEFDNVTVNYGTWMNYHYCEPTPGLNGGRGMRVEPGFAYGGLPTDFDHSQCVDNHYNCIPFDQLFGGTQTACKGVKAWEGVTVNYPAEYTCTLCGQQHNVK